MTYGELSIVLMGIDDYQLVFAYGEKWDVKRPYFDETRIIVARCNHFREVVCYLQETDNFLKPISLQN